jgi:hypothetical protein
MNPQLPYRNPHIKERMTLDEIRAEYAEGEYCAEMLLQHLLEVVEEMEKETRE